jgi:hypothetical protein
VIDLTELLRHHSRQLSFIEKVIRRFNVSSMTGISTPAIPNVTLSKPMQPKTPDEEVAMNIPYRELVGCLLYAAVITRADISFCH